MVIGKFSDEMGQSEVQFPLFDHKHSKALLGWEGRHWVLPGMLTYSEVEDIVERIQKHVNLEDCLWPAHITWSIKQEWRFTSVNGKSCMMILEKVVMVVDR